jgi:hypothetical protein
MNNKDDMIEKKSIFAFGEDRLRLNNAIKTFFLVIVFGLHYLCRLK